MKKNTKQDKDFWIIGVGASAGGLEALTSFFKSLPPKPNAAFVIAQHLAPHSKSMMVELLSRQTDLPVIQVRDHLELEPGVISIVPPNYDVTAQDGELRLTIADNMTRPKPSVDVLFTSLAKVHGKKAVGIILSGTGSDGTEGIRNIKEFGGITIVQDPNEAKYDGMPRSAIDIGPIDYILPLEKMAKNLFEMLESHSEDSQSADPVKTHDKKEFDQILEFIKKHAGPDYTQYKISTLQRRVQKRLNTLGINNLKSYIDILKTSPTELNELSQNMLVSVTSFYRDPEAFASITQCLEKMILDKRAGDDLRLWVAGCATGEEAYTFTFIINDIIHRTGKAINLKIFATDLDHEALAYARNGVYSKKDVADLSAEHLKNYFDQRDSNYVVKKIYRDAIVFAKQDIIQNPPFVKLDLVSCRNVLIYFEPDLQEKVFEIFHYSLKPSGILFLGKSESVNNSFFEVINRKEKIFQRVNVISKFNHSGRYRLGNYYAPSLLKKKAPKEDLQEVAALEILKELGVSGLVIDEDTNILHMLGDVSTFLTLPDKTPDFRLTNLVPKSAALDISVLIKKAAKENKFFSSRTFLKVGDQEQPYTFKIKALSSEDVEVKKIFVVIFEHEHKQTQEVQAPAVFDGPDSAHLYELQQELNTTRENLQTVIEELEVSNEELQSLNEELSSANEELQASNEELETTNEELQSTNEELMTLNDELSIKTSELKTAYANLDNIQGSINSPLIVIDEEMKILRFNSSSNMIFNLSHSDYGQKITGASCQCEIPDFQVKIKETLNTAKVTEAQCEANGKIFQLVIHPALNDQKKVVGAILFFFDNTSIIKAHEKLSLTDKRLRAVMDSSPTLISLKDNQGRYLMVNETFCKTFDLKDEHIIGKTDRELFDEDNAAYFRENDLEVILKRSTTDKEETISFKGRSYALKSNRFPLYGQNDRTPYAIGWVALDITDQKIAQKELLASEKRYRAMIEDQAVVICRYKPDGEILYSNQFFKEYFSEVSSADFHKLIIEKDRPKASREVSKITFHHPVVHFDTRVRGKTDVRWMRWIHRGIFNDKEELIEFQTVGLDVTEIHKQTSGLLAKEALFTHVLEYTSDYLSVYRSENGKFYLESMNQSAAFSRGGKPQNFIGKELQELVDPNQKANIMSRFLDSIQKVSIDTFEESLEGSAGKIYLSTTIVPIYEAYSDTVRVAALSRDITRLKRIEKDLRDEKQNAEKANTAKSDFLASMSHELRTPLNVMLGMSQLLKRGKLETNQVKLVESIQRSGKVLLSLIEDVLDLAKIEAGKVNFESRPIDMDQLTQDVFQSFETDAQAKNLNFVRHYKVTPNVPVMGDEVRIKQILINLIGNALKFTDEGSIELNISLLSKEHHKYTFYFEVKDSGIGIPEESHSKIFGRFSQAESGTTRKYGGTGLGLAICKQLVELMNGNIGFNSQENKGSTFWFQIELSEAVSDFEGDVGKMTEPVDLSGIKILAVDDNAEALKVLSYYFNDKSVEYELAKSGKEALEKLDRNKFDLIFMDMQMPGMDGLEATQIIRKDRKLKVPVIALTANAHSEDKNKCLASGMDDFVTKPIDFDILEKVITKWVQK